MINGAFGSSLSPGSYFVTRQPISIFRQIIETKDEKEREELNKLLGKLRNSLPDGFKIGAAVGAGDCFFDSVAQGLKDKNSITIGVKSLRKSCKQYAKEHKQPKSSSWLNKDLKGKNSNIKNYVQRIGFTAEDIKNSSSNSVIEKLALKDAICGEDKIEGKMIREKYNVKIKVIELCGEEWVDVTTGEEDKGDNVVYIVNYGKHFVPLP